MRATQPGSRFIDLRAATDVGYVRFDREEDGIDYRAELSYRSFSGFVDVKPFVDGFRLTARLYSRPFELELDASGADVYEVGDREFFGDLDLDGELSLGSATPYLGIGWGGTTNGKGFGASFDLGLQFAGSPDVDLEVNGRACDATLDPDCNPNGTQGFDVNDPNDARAQIFQRELDREIDELEDDAEDFKIVPVATFGLHYRFGLGRSSRDPTRRQATAAPVAPAIAAPVYAPPPVPAQAPPQPAFDLAPPATTAPAARAPGARLSAGPLTAPRALRLRTRPTVQGPEEGALPAGTAVKLSVRRSNADGAWWYVEPVGGSAGWVLESELLP